MWSKRLLFVLLAISAFYIDVCAQILIIEGNAFSVRLNNQDMTAEIYDSKYVIDDREFPLSRKERKFKNRAVQYRQSCD